MITKTQITKEQKARKKMLDSLNRKQLKLFDKWLREFGKIYSIELTIIR